MQNGVTAIIVAGGEGKRMETDIPKQFLPLDGKPIIIHTLEKFENNDRVANIVVVCHKDHIDRLEAIIEEEGIKKISKIAPGGKTRQESSYEGVKACPEGTDIVLVHDAVRPFVTDKIINDVIEAAIETGAAGCAIEVTDTIIEVKNSLITAIPDRKTLKRIQTPQGFKRDIIRSAHEKALEDGILDATDDCGLVIALGIAVKLVDGSGTNIKITTFAERKTAENFVSKNNGKLE